MCLSELKCECVLLGNTGLAHWQTLWAKNMLFQRVRTKLIMLPQTDLPLSLVLSVIRTVSTPALFHCPVVHHCVCTWDCLNNYDKNNYESEAKGRERVVVLFCNAAKHALFNTKQYINGKKEDKRWGLSQTPISLSDTDLQRGKRFWFWILVFLCKKGEREPSGKDMYFQLKLTHYNTTVTFNTQKYYTQELRWVQNLSFWQRNNL